MLGLGGGALMALRYFCCWLVLLNMIYLAATLDEAASDTSLGLPEISLENSQEFTAQYSGGSSNGGLQGPIVCKGKDISISQSQTGHTSGGIPRFTVNIVNTCYTTNYCYPWNVHLYCGSFASAELVNPNTFKRIAVNDCVVNNGLGLKFGDILSFTYANSVMYPLRYKSMQWC